MATSAKIKRNSSHDHSTIGVRSLDDADMTSVAAEVESEHAPLAPFDAGAPQGVGANIAHGRGGPTRGRGGP